MTRNDKNLEIEMASTVHGTKVHFVLLKGGQMYYRMKDICKHTERYPGEYRDSVSVFSYVDLYNTGNISNKKNHIDVVFRYARIWYEGCAYVHETDLRNYILERQGKLENRLRLRTKGCGACGWSVEAAATINKLFHIKVICSGKHERINCPKEIAEQYAKNPKLRAAFVAYNGIIKGLQIQKRLAPYWAKCVELDEQLQSWKTEQGDAE